MIGAGYWQSGLYKKPIKPTLKPLLAPTSLSLRPRATNCQKTAEARSAYQKLIKTYPQASETGLGLLRLAQISPNRDAIAYLDRIVKQFPDRAPEALEAKAKLLNSTNAQAASQTGKLY